MKESFVTMFGSYASLVFICATILSTGCLYAGDPGHIAADPGAVVSLEGTQVELIRHSSGCDSAESKGLIVEVGPGLEYSADVVRALQPSCDLAINPGVEVHVEDRAVILDFSNIEEPGRFADAEFEGYILKIVHAADAPLLVAATVDPQTTAMDVVQDDLSYDVESVAINLADRVFDSGSFLKIHLFLASVSVPVSSGQM